jgi:hypothetical protein
MFGPAYCQVAARKLLGAIRPGLALRILRLLQDRSDHLVAHLRRLGESRLEVLLDALELLPVRVEVAQADALTPVARGECKFEIVGAECVVVDGGVDRFLEERRVAEQRLCDTEPHTEELSNISLITPKNDA